jgi:hypothetical protein
MSATIGGFQPIGNSNYLNYTTQNLNSSSLGNSQGIQNNLNAQMDLPGFNLDGTTSSPLAPDFLGGQAPQSQMGAGQWAGLGIGAFNAVTGFLGQKEQLKLLERNTALQENMYANALKKQEATTANSIANKEASNASFLAGSNQTPERKV